MILEGGEEKMAELTDAEILPLSLEHNFWTWSAQAHVNPIPVTKADGVYFWDADGKRYLDFNSMVMCVNIGHGNQHVIEAMVNQARELPFAGPSMATKPRAVLGDLLTQVVPQGLNSFSLYPGWRRRQRKCHQAGARLYRAA